MPWTSAGYKEAHGDNRGRKTPWDFGQPRMCAGPSNVEETVIAARSQQVTPARLRAVVRTPLPELDTESRNITVRSYGQF